VRTFDLLLLVTQIETYLETRALRFEMLSGGTLTDMERER